jgi:hypothetical protein
MRRIVFPVAVLLCILAWWINHKAFFAAYLAAWWFWVGIMMGGLANVWMHNLTGGKWGEAIRMPLLHAARGMWPAALLFLPVLIGMKELYPWAAHAGEGIVRWSGELSSPSFKSMWLMPGFFIARSIIYLLLWCLLAWLAQRPSLRRSQHFAAAALLLYGFSMSLASVDWIMSLMPLWYSSVFGWLTGTGQMMAGMAAAIVWAARRANPPPSGIFRDLGNLLLMYVMIWAYLAFVQFLIIWAENLPHEIAWYLPRTHGMGLVMAWILIVFLFAAPLVILLFRHVKDSPRLLGGLAAALLIVKLIDCWWLVLPSVPMGFSVWAWTAPLMIIALGAIGLEVFRYGAVTGGSSEVPHV